MALNSGMYRDYLVTFIDILGFRALLKERTAEEIDEVLSALYSTFQAWDKYDYLNVFQFSDCVVRARPLGYGDSDEPIRSGGVLFNELRDLSYSQGCLLRRGILIRGGLTLGKIAVNGNKIFGPALVRAYELESKVAIYPRIVVDKNLINVFESDRRLHGLRFEIPRDQLVEDFLSYCKIDAAVGGFIDYLGNAVDYINGWDWDETFSAFRKTIAQGMSLSTNNAEIHSKYVWLANYFNSTLHELTFSTAICPPPPDFVQSAVMRYSLRDVAGKHAR